MPDLKKNKSNVLHKIIKILWFISILNYYIVFENFPIQLIAKTLRKIRHKVELKIWELCVK